MVVPRVFRPVPIRGERAPFHGSKEPWHLDQRVMKLIVTSVADKFRETEQLVERIDRRLEEIHTELSQLKSETINRDHLTETLAQFGPLWEVLNETERTRLVQLLVESAVYNPASGSVQISIAG